MPERVMLKWIRESHDRHLMRLAELIKEGDKEAEEVRDLRGRSEDPRIKEVN